LKSFQAIIIRIKTSFFPCEWLGSQNPLWINSSRYTYIYVRKLCVEINWMWIIDTVSLYASVSGKLHFQTNKSSWKVYWWWQIRGTYYYRCYYSRYFSNTYLWSVFTILCSYQTFETFCEMVNESETMNGIHFLSIIFA